MSQPGGGLLELVEVMDRLRRECPWDREQTHESLARHLLEEAYEVLEALDSGDRGHLREELGDLLLQVVFHARIAAEDPCAPWDLDDVAADITAKLVRRHPHVFGASSAADAAAVEVIWEQQKAVERGRTPAVEDIPASLPALARADKLLRRAERAGSPSGQNDAERDPVDRQVGAALLEQVRTAQAAGVDAEGALRRTLRELETALRCAD